MLNYKNHNYKNHIEKLYLSKKIPEDIVSIFNQQRKRSKPPTQAFSEFLTNREQGDWAERLVLSAINKVNKDFVAVQYGKS
ncbi:MAG: AccI family restriction endonuclease, partial [bacterium JZ-2024 1]